MLEAFRTFKASDAYKELMRNEAERSLKISEKRNTMLAARRAYEQAFQLDDDLANQRIEYDDLNKLERDLLDNLPQHERDMRAAEEEYSKLVSTKHTTVAQLMITDDA